MLEAEYAIAHMRRGLSDREILITLAQGAAKLADAALERLDEGSITKDKRDDLALAAAIGRIEAVAEVAIERLKLEVANPRKKAGIKWARKIDPDWRIHDDQE